MAKTPQEPRARVLAAALELFGEKGYGGTSLQAIGDRLGITKAAVYYHYRAKVALLTNVAEPLLARVEALADHRTGRWTQATCRDLLGDYLDVIVGARVLARVLLSDPTASDHPAAARMRAEQRRLRDLLVSPRGDKKAGKVRASCALGALEGAVLDFSDTQPGRHRATILGAALAALVPSPVSRAPMAKRR